MPTIEVTPIEKLLIESFREREHKRFGMFIVQTHEFKIVNILDGIKPVPQRHIQAAYEEEKIRALHISCATP